MNFNKTNIFVSFALFVVLFVFFVGGYAQSQKITPNKIMKSETSKPFVAVPYATFEHPWALTVLPDNSFLITEKTGKLKLFNPTTKKTVAVSGIPKVDYGGQGGLGDIILHPQFLQNQLVYISYVEAGSNNTRGAVVAVAKLHFDKQPRLTGQSVIWRQYPKTTGWGHYSHRLLVSPDKQYLFISSGDRQKLEPAQNKKNNLGSMVRLQLDGSIPQDNPFVKEKGITAQLWTLGHRNILGMAFDENGQLWANEMGPRGGDELNKIVKGNNYGWPIVSDGNHYNGVVIPNHNTRSEFYAPAMSWVPSISPSGLIIYQGDKFPLWRGNAIMGGLSSRALVRVAIKDNKGYEVGRYDMDARIREVAQDQDGNIWLLEDGASARLLKLVSK